MDKQQQEHEMVNSVNNSDYIINNNNKESKKSHKYAEDIYAAEKILDQKYKKSKRFFLIKWQGWDPSYNTWEPEENILDEQLIETFVKSLKRSKKVKNRNNSNNKKLLNTKTLDKKDDEQEVDLNTKNNQVLDKTPITDSLLLNEGDDLRSVKRIAEGLRPIGKHLVGKPIAAAQTKSTETPSASTSSSNSISIKHKIRLWNTNRNNSSKKIIQNKITSNSSINSDSNSQFDDDDDDESIDGDDENRSHSNKNLQSPPIKKRIILKKIVDDSSDDDGHILSSSKFKKNVSSINRITEEDDNKNENVKSFADDIFITDITSGFVTVTIKECATSEGFFKHPIE